MPGVFYADEAARREFAKVYKKDQPYAEAVNPVMGASRRVASRIGGRAL
jgi:hypothetical protein